MWELLLWNVSVSVLCKPGLSYLWQHSYIPTWLLTWAMTCKGKPPVRMEDGSMTAYRCLQLLFFLFIFLRQNKLNNLPFCNKIQMKVWKQFATAFREAKSHDALNSSCWMRRVCELSRSGRRRRGVSFRTAEEKQGKKGGREAGVVLTWRSCQSDEMCVELCVGFILPSGSARTDQTSGRLKQLLLRGEE